MQLGKTPIVVVRAALVTDTRDNTSYRDWAHASSTTVTDNMVEPFLLSNQLIKENNAGREFSATIYRVWSPPAAGIEYTDRVEYLGDTYEVWGHPQLWVDFRNKPHHWNFLMKLREG